MMKEDGKTLDEFKDFTIEGNFMIVSLTMTSSDIVKDKSEMYEDY